MCVQGAVLCPQSLFLRITAMKRRNPNNSTGNKIKHKTSNIVTLETSPRATYEETQGNFVKFAVHDIHICIKKANTYNPILLQVV